MSYYSEDCKKNFDIAIHDILRICSTNLIQFQMSGSLGYVISETGLLMLEQLGDSENRLHRIGVLQLVMTTDTRVPDLVKRQILFGLLLQSRSGLTILKEHDQIIVPAPQLEIKSTLEGSIRFRSTVTSPIRKVPPDLEYFCLIKSDIPAYEIIWFLLSKLESLDASDSLLGTFRLKSYPSIMNKLFYRGGRLTDLFAATVDSPGLVDLQETMKAKCAMDASEVQEDFLNGNNCVVYRYVRVLDVDIRKDSSKLSFSFSVYYEIVSRNNKARVPHEQYELDRLEFGVKSGSLGMCSQHGFSLEGPFRANIG